MSGRDPPCEARGLPAEHSWAHARRCCARLEEHGLLLPVTPARLAQLKAFLRSVGLDPTAPGGPGASAAALAPLEEALSHSSLGEALNHERLEFLGDAVLRLAATEFLRREHPTLRVGEQSSLRGHLVSDRWLASFGEQCGLAAVVRLGPMAFGDAAGRATVLAESVEALLGAIYLAWGGPAGGLDPVIHWLSPHWRQSAAEVLADPYQQNWKSALQEWSQRQGLGLPHYGCEERSLAHGDPRRFYSWVGIGSDRRQTLGEGWGRTKRSAEQQAARQAMHRATAGSQANDNRFEPDPLLDKKQDHNQGSPS
ncbi:MAG: ribonuclease III domain-containing protein [Cyanobacteriota bacterium]|nr:ribonuclease III domain-containing protein [Cyanobacteriota bacterium]